MIDPNVFNQLVINDWQCFSKESVRLMLNVFQSVEHIQWERVYKNKAEFGLSQSAEVPFERKSCLYKKKYIDWMADLKIRNVNCITQKHYSFPIGLKHVDPKCELLYAKGDSQSLTQAHRVAIVGTRRPTTYGRKVASELSKGLAERGVVIVSGMAMGIDAVAHTAALDAGGKTIGVLASGIDYVYPKTNAYLYNRMMKENGLFVSEKSDALAPKPYQFPLRNRLISGISEAIILIEASEKSGTLITAHHALEQGKTIFAVPGSIYSDQSKGTNRLILEGAVPLLSCNQVCEYLNIQTEKILRKNKSPIPRTLSELAKKLYDIIYDWERLSIETLIDVSKCEYSEIASALSELILEDLCERSGINEICIK